jgi:chorismate mutase
MSQNHDDKQDPTHENIPTATSRVEHVHLLQGAEKEPTGRTLHLVLGVEQHPSTRLWQVWISRTGTDIQVVSAHRERQAAEATVVEIKRVAALGELFDEEKGVGTLKRLREAGDGEPEPLSHETIHTIYRTIEAAVWKQEQEREH